MNYFSLKKNSTNNLFILLSLLVNNLISSPGLECTRHSQAYIYSFLIIIQYHLFPVFVRFAAQLRRGIQQVAGFQVKRKMLVQLGLGYKIQCQYSLLHHILITLCANGIYLITHIIKYNVLTKLRSPFVKLCERSKLTIHGAAPSSCEPVVTVAKGIFAFV